MPARSELHIIAPGICGPLAETQSLKNNKNIDKWANILARARSTESFTNVNSLLAQLFHLDIADDFPSAAFTLLANGLYDETQYCMHADPVHLQADMDHAILTSSADLNITADESHALCLALNQHLNQDGLNFTRLNNNQWFVTTENKIQMNTTALSEAVGRNINFILPEGKDAMRWKQLLTEAQMLMYGHQVNESREAASKLVINSLWLHGAGALPTNDKIKPDSLEINSLCSNSDLFKGVAEYTKCDYLEVPHSVDDYASHLLNATSIDHSSHVLHLSTLEHLVNYTDVSIWLAQLLEQLENWVYPLLKIAHQKNIKVILYPCNEKQYHFSRYDDFRFWQRGKIEQHVHSY